MKSDRHRIRRKRQNGSISVKGKKTPYWFGEWREYEWKEDGTLRPVHRSMNLGYCSETTELEARLELDRVVHQLNDPINFPTVSRRAADRAKNGAAAEMLAAWHLFQKGCEVFKSLHGASPCDLIAIDPSGQILRVEVKLAPINGGFNPSVSLGRQKDKFDLLILVTPKGEIYERTHEELILNSNCFRSTPRKNSKNK